jgi:hypothetical protein
MKKCLLSIVLSLIILGSYIAPLQEGGYVRAEASEREALRPGREVFSAAMGSGQMRAVPKRMITRTKSKAKRAASPSDSLDDFWEQCSGRYFYSRLSEKQKAYYHQLDGVSRAYLNGRGEAEEYEGYYYMEDVCCRGLSVGQMFDVTWIFLYENPQYFFLDGGLGYDLSSSDREKRVFVALCVYKDYARPKKVLADRDAIRGKIEQYLKGAKKYTSNLGKELYFHDRIAKDTEYKENAYDQSIASVFLHGESVCMGYSGAFSILMNLSGMKTMVVTSKTHAWNQVLQNGRWYLVDVTWDDDDKTGVVHDYFNISSKAAKALDHTAKFHVPEETFVAFGAPVCTAGEKNKKEET